MYMKCLYVTAAARFYPKMMNTSPEVKKNKGLKPYSAKFMRVFWNPKNIR